MVVAKFSSVADVVSGDEDDLTSVLTQYGPVAVMVDAAK